VNTSAVPMTVIRKRLRRHCRSRSAARNTGPSASHKPSRHGERSRELHRSLRVTPSGLWVGL
jgi:hypothetical protein